jgi:hypothetical protein
MEDPYRLLAQNINSGVAVSVSQYLRQFEQDEMVKAESKETFTFHLFACFITGNLVHARMLWKRAPKAMKGAGEIEKVWEVGRNLLKSNIPAALKVIHSYHWILSEQIVKLLRQKLFEDQKKRMQLSYICLELLKVAEHLALSKSEAVEQVERWGWKIEDDFVYPAPLQPRRPRGIEDNDISVITQLVNYLEQKVHIGID